MLKIIRLKNQKLQLCRSGPTFNWLANQKPSRELGKNKNKRVKEGKGIERLALLKVRRIFLRLTFPRPTLARLEKSRKKPWKKFQRSDITMIPARWILLKSYAITIIRWIIMPSTLSSKKTSSKWLLKTLQMRSLYLLPSLL